MEKQLMIYEQAVPVSKERHKNWSVNAGQDYDFAHTINSVPLLVAEFESAAREYPIIFAKANDSCAPTAMVGLQETENAFVTAAHSWDADYIPAFIRRYPFVFSKSSDGDTFTLCLDEGFSGCNQDGEGEALFDNDGETSDYLKQIIGFTTAFQRESQATGTFCDMLTALDILTPGELKFQLEDGASRVIKGLLTVDKDRLKALPADKLSELAQSGDLEKIYAHLLSLRNFDAVADRLKHSSNGGQLSGQLSGLA